MIYLKSMGTLEDGLSLVLFNFGLIPQITVTTLLQARQHKAYR